MGFEEDRSANLRERGLMPRPGWRPDLIHRPGVGTSLREGWCHDRPESPCSRLVLDGACARRYAGRKVVPSASIRCMKTASLRASATFAVFMPARVALRIPQLFKTVE